ncbi:MAG TPA: hypothetical protein VGA88_08145 [Burkholderiales bacterium]|jgi:hypothetical protein
MAAWLPVLKTVLPYVTTIVTSALPVFTAKKDNERIAELQNAVKHNAESVRVLAEQLQRTVQAIEAGAASAERAVKRARRVSVVSLIVATAALLVVIASMWI